MEELFFLAVLITGLFMFLYHMNSPESEEGFDENVILRGCPAGMKTFYLSNGSTGCCQGEVTGNRCIGPRQCTMTGTGGKDLPNCATYVKEHQRSQAKKHCPPSMPSYFEDSTKKQKGCTSGPVEADLSRPLQASQPKCRVYATMEQTLRAKDSCHHYKEMDAFRCFGTQCTTSIFATPEANAPPLVMVHFMDRSGIYRTAYTRKSFENYLNMTRPQWRNEGIDLTKNINVAEVAKAFYVDRTLSQTDIQL